MKLTLIVFSIVLCGCLATPVEVVQNKLQKRSIGEDLLGGYYGSSYGLSSSALAIPSITSAAFSAPSITSHTHTHSTAIIDRPYPVAIKAPVITSASILPSTLSYNYGLSSYPYNFGYPYGSLGYGGNYYSGFGKYYSSGYPTIYKKSFYSSPTYKYKW